MYPNLKEYTDNEAGVRECLLDVYPPEKIKPDVIEPDPHAVNVWLAIDSKQKMVMVVYLAENDAEQIEYISKNPNDYMR